MPTVPRLDGDNQELAEIQNQGLPSDERAEQLETETMTGHLGILSTDSGRRAVRSAYGAMERLLPEPPQPAVVRGQAETGGGFVVQHRQTKSEPQRILRVTNPSPTTSPARPTPIPGTQSIPTKNRQVSTESTLSDILRSTERRLQERGTSGVSRRNRATIAAASGPHRGLSLHVAKRLEESRDPGLRRSEALKETRRTRAEHELPVISPSRSGLVAPLTLVPKPSEQEQRPDSRESLSSDPDSLLAEPASSEMPSGLTSPSRVSSIAGTSSVAETDIEMLLLTMDMPSNRSSMTSAASLSTIHSEDESSEGEQEYRQGLRRHPPTSDIVFGLHDIKGLRSPSNKSTTYNNTLLNSIVLPPPTKHRYVDAKTVVVESKPPVRSGVAHTPERKRRWPFINTHTRTDDGNIHQPPSSTPRSGSRLSRQWSLQQQERKTSESLSIYSQDFAANEAFSPASVPTFMMPIPSSPTRTSLPPSPTSVGLAAAQALNTANFQRNSILFAGAQQQTPSRRTSRTGNTNNRVSMLSARRHIDDVEEDDNKENMAITPKASPIAATIAQLRRMNSVLSTASSVSSINTEVADGGGNGNLSRRNSSVATASPSQSALRGGGFNPNPRRDSHHSYGHWRSGSRNYLFVLSGGAGAVPPTPSTPKVLKRAGGSGNGSGSGVRPLLAQVNAHYSRTGSGSDSGSGIGRVVSISRSGSPQRTTLTPTHGHHRSLGGYGGSSVLGNPSPINVNILKNRFQFNDEDDDNNDGMNESGRAGNVDGSARKQESSGFLAGSRKNDVGEEEESKRKLPVRFTLPNSSPTSIEVTVNLPPSSPSPRSKQAQTGMVYVTPKGKRWRDRVMRVWGFMTGTAS
ncbi:hypothetical protein SMACR_08369 [Sordaria macrospora]|uniref:Uncharacterized protein n=1 Tax=Sordaria macrospora TaxID=5147 RepID=A0A8S8ZR27_SORMA|nr:hypothetical protein SMACR_08369 [Sordaria macrospora]WPJ60175.1 hypothetical protein SMAC4_08369 [Sordaria macrospora]